MCVASSTQTAVLCVGHDMLAAASALCSPGRLCLRPYTPRQGCLWNCPKVSKSCLGTGEALVSDRRACLAGWSNLVCMNAHANPAFICSCAPSPLQSVVPT